MYGRGCMLYSHHNVLSVLRVILLLQESSSFSFLVCVVYILFHKVWQWDGMFLEGLRGLYYVESNQANKPILLW